MDKIDIKKIIVGVLVAALVIGSVVAYGVRKYKKYESINDGALEYALQTKNEYASVIETVEDYVTYEEDNTMEVYTSAEYETGVDNVDEGTEISTDDIYVVPDKPPTAEELGIEFTTLGAGWTPDEDIDDDEITVAEYFTDMGYEDFCIIWCEVDEDSYYIPDIVEKYDVSRYYIISVNNTCIDAVLVDGEVLYELEKDEY
jgi:hypothetical protein